MFETKHCDDTVSDENTTVKMAALIVGAKFFDFDDKFQPEDHYTSQQMVGD